MRLFGQLLTPENAAGRVRRAGFLLVVSGMLLLAISAGDVLADAVQRGFRGDEQRSFVSDSANGSGPGKIVHGTGGWISSTELPVAAK